LLPVLDPEKHGRTSRPWHPITRINRLLKHFLRNNDPPYVFPSPPIPARTQDDPIDVEKLAHLYRGGYIKRVHHAEWFDRMVFKRHVGLYHDGVRQRVRQGLTRMLPVGTGWRPATLLGC